MAETRMMPRHTTRSTGIDRTTQIHNRPNSSAGNNATSHVSAAPGVNARTHEHVVQARNPAGVNRPAPQRAVGGSLVSGGGGGGGRAAKVEIFPSVLGDAGRAALSSQGRPTVQVIQAPRRAGTPDVDLGGAGAGFPAPAHPAFSPQQMLLIASLLEQYEERVGAVKDVNNLAIARGALDVLRQMHAWSIGVQPRPAPAPILPVPTPVSAPAMAHAVAASIDLDASLVAPRELDASTSTTVVSAASRPAGKAVAVHAHPDHNDAGSSPDGTEAA